MKIRLNGGYYTNSLGIVEENIVVNLELDQLAIDLSTTVGVTAAGLQNVRIENILNSPINCLLPALVALNLTSLQVSLGNIATATITGFIAPGLDAFLNNAV